MRTTLKLRLLVLIVPWAAMPLTAQSTAADVYAESYRQGSTRVIEESFEVKLSPQDSLYRERIKDLRGNDRYAFSIVPLGPEGDSKITSWQGKLSDLLHPIYDNVLLVSPNPSDDPKNETKNALFRLWPSTFAPVPPGARRIMKVDNFYVVLQVKAFHFTPPESPYLDSMTVEVEFRNTDPRQPEASGK